jgi:hypothetical protein
MIVRSVRSRFLYSDDRLDANYYTSAGTEAAEVVALAQDNGVAYVVLGGPSGVAHVFAPKRFRRVYAAPGEVSVPYLRPYDIFEYLPSAADNLSVTRTGDLDSYRVQAGDILQTCSGRNLGPAVMVDEFISEFVQSHDLIRIRIPDAELRNYIFAFMASSTGQALLRRDKSGSVIDHITVGHVSDLEVPLLPKRVRRKVSSLIDQAWELSGKARRTLDEAVRSVEARVGEYARPVPRSGWTTRSAELVSRIDAAPFAPSVRAARDAVAAAGGVPMSDIAEVYKPAGRYKTYYVSQDFGRPILSGRQLLQSKPTNLQFISPKSFSDVAPYVLREGLVAFPADGRAEESLGKPVLITNDRADWLASGHVGRLRADRANAGWLWVCCSMSHVREQISSLACGSVVDALYPDDLARVLVPPVDALVNDAVWDAWADLAKSAKLEADASRIVEAGLRRLARNEVE